MLYKVLLLFNVIERLIEQHSRLEWLRIEVHKVLGAIFIARKQNNNHSV